MRDDVRAGDADRDSAGAHLREAFAAGRLTFEEFQFRLDRVYAAPTRREIGQLTADLPHDGQVMPGGPGVPGAARSVRAGYAPGAQARPGQPGPSRRPRRARLRARALLALAGLVSVWLLIAYAVAHTGLLAAVLLVLLGLMLATAVFFAGLFWMARRIWQRGAWLEAVPLLAGQPWLSRPLWAVRVLRTGRALGRLRGRFRPAA